ncbi:putative disease resistance RPP13-like protein 2 isoform X2 [Salvia splendens]|uniref:putative disease resistance RPP13-like protein 2 isoform X2 n=1 Tax=Salvia splendens TaxID=180675 RepID=UPI001C26E6C2|nr:putative disease resistance RPP13-like protein 2 isoform X2 [Salvia splendens]
MASGSRKPSSPKSPSLWSPSETRSRLSATASVEEQIKSRTHPESAEYKSPPGKPKYVVGFVDKEKEIKDGLTKCTQHLDAIFVTGMHGVGKTTLVAKVFHDPDIRKNFTIAPIWVHASNSTTKHILVDILRQLDELPQDASQRCAEDLSILVASCLEGRKFLIVMDDVHEHPHDRL